MPDPAVPSNVVSAIAVSIGPTLLGLATWRQAHGAKREAAGANAAVNHKSPSSPSISEQVDRIDRRTLALTEDVGEVRGEVADLRRVVAVVRTAVAENGLHFEKHLAFHQSQIEKGSNG